MAEKKQAKLSRVLGTLERVFGKYRHPMGDSLLDRLVSLILGDGEAADDAESGVHALQQEFLDWNEVRVSSLTEISSVLPHLEPQRATLKAARLRDTLTRVFDTHHKMTLQFLMDLDPPARRDFLDRLNTVDAWVGQIVVLLCEEEPTVQDAPHAARVAKRLGILERNATPSKARKALGELLNPDDFYRFHSHFVRLGETVCTVKAYQCQSCCLNKDCDEGISVMRARKANAGSSNGKKVAAKKKEKPSAPVKKVPPTSAPAEAEKSASPPTPAKEKPKTASPKVSNKPTAPVKKTKAPAKAKPAVKAKTQSKAQKTKPSPQPKAAKTAQAAKKKAKAGAKVSAKPAKAGSKKAAPKKTAPKKAAAAKKAGVKKKAAGAAPKAAATAKKKKTPSGGKATGASQKATKKKGR